MAKFVVFELVSETIYEKLSTPKDKLSNGTVTAVNLGSGLISGIAAAIISQPADTLLSKINKQKVILLLMFISPQLIRAKMVRALPAAYLKCPNNSVYAVYSWDWAREYVVTILVDPRSTNPFLGCHGWYSHSLPIQYLWRH
jgi:hypothetical protein